MTNESLLEFNEKNIFYVTPFSPIHCHGSRLKNFLFGIFRTREKMTRFLGTNHLSRAAQNLFKLFTFTEPCFER